MTVPEVLQEYILKKIKKHRKLAPLYRFYGRGGALPRFCRLAVWSLILLYVYEILIQITVADTDRYDFSVGDFSDGYDIGAHSWRGYKFKLNKSVCVSALRGGKWGPQHFRPDFSMALFRVFPNGTIAEVLADEAAPRLRAASRSLDEPISLVANVPYCLAQGYAIDNNRDRHFVVDGLHVDDLKNSLSFIEEWEPSDGSSFSLDRGFAEDMIGLDLSSPSSRPPDIGFVTTSPDDCLGANNQVFDDKLGPYVCPNGTIPNDDQSQCVACQSYQIATEEDSECSICPNGTVPNHDQSQCCICAKYEYSAPTDSTCRPCGFGEVPTADQTSCLSCSAREYSALEDDICIPFLTDGLLPNRTFTIVSNCGTNDLDEPCAMSGLSSDVRISFNLAGASTGANTTIEEETRFVAYVRSTDGSPPSVEINCAGDATDDFRVYIGCNPIFVTMDLPLIPSSSYRLLRNSSCASSGQSDCRNFVFVGSLALTSNTSSLLFEHLRKVANTRQRLLSSESMILLPLKVRVGTLNKPSVLNIKQELALEAELSMNGHQSPSRNVSPQRFVVIRRKNAVTEREYSTLSKVIVLSLEAGDEWRWDIPAGAGEYIEPPEGGVTPIPTNISQLIHIDPKTAPVGVTTLNLKVEIWNTVSEFSEFYPVDVTILIRQALVQVSRTRLAVQLSFSDTDTTRSISFANKGDYKTVWSASLIDMESDKVMWARLNGTHTKLGEMMLHPGENTNIEVRFLPGSVPSSGEYRAFLLIKTDALDGEPVGPTQYELNGTAMWVELVMVLRTVFVCNPGPIGPPLSPMDERLVPLKVLNAEVYDIVILLQNFTIRELEPPFAVHNIQQPRQCGSLDLSSWMGMFPVSQRVRPGATATYFLHVFYVSSPLFLCTESGARELNVSQYHIQFSLTIWTYNSESFWSKIETRTVQTQVEFTPGTAVPENSIVNVSSNEMLVGNIMAVDVEFRDVFNKTEAYALYYDDASDANFLDGVPSVYILREPLGDQSSSLPFDFELHSHLITSGTMVTKLAMNFFAVSPGTARIDIRLNQSSIQGSPFNITVVPVECSDREAIPDSTGLTCVCRPGFHRDSSNNCAFCPEGTFSSTASNDNDCNMCPTGTFSNPGSTQCYECPTEGVVCSQGKLRLLPNTWCDLCSMNSTLEAPRDKITWRLKEGKPVEFMTCRHREACIVNRESFVTQCSEGYQGVMCDTCESGHVKNWNDNSCISCQDQQKNIIYTVLQVLILLGGITVVACRKATKDSTENPLSDFESTMSDSFEEVGLAFLDYLQMMSIIASLDINPFPDGVQEHLRWSFLNPASSVRVHCLTELDVRYSSAITMLFPLPLALLVSFVQFLVCWFSYRRTPTGKYFCMATLPTIVRFLDFVHGSVAEVSFSALDVYKHPIGSGRSLSTDLSIKEGDESFYILRILAGVVTVVYVIGFPVVTCLYLYQKFSNARESGNVHALYDRFSNLVGGYNIERGGYVWPFITVLRKVLLLLVVVYADQFQIQLVFVTTVAIGSFLLCSVMRPHTANVVTYVEFANTASVWMTASLGALRYWIDEHSSALHYVWISPTQAATVIQNLVIMVQSIVCILTIAACLVFFPYAFAEKYQMLLQWYLKTRRRCSRCYQSFGRRCSFCERARIKSSNPTMVLCNPGTLHVNANGAGNREVLPETRLSLYRKRQLMLMRKEPKYKARNREAYEAQLQIKPFNPKMIANADTYGGRGSKYDQNTSFKTRLSVDRKRRLKLKEPNYKARHREASETSRHQTAEPQARWYHAPIHLEHHA